MQADLLASDEQFLAAFLDSSLPAAAFDHRGHLRAAWLLLRQHPLEVAVERICDGIARLAERLGAPHKYHRTLTEALVRLMAAAGAAATPTWQDFLAENPGFVQDARRQLTRHYSEQRLALPEARRSFLPPDLLPLPACPH